MKKRFIATVMSIAMTFSLALSSACVGKQGEQGKTPQIRISETTNEWEVSYDDGESWTSLGVTASVEGPQGTSPKLQINAQTLEWEVSYDNGTTWTSLGVKATEQGPQGITPKLQINKTTNEWEVSYDNGATWTSLGVKASGGSDNSESTIPTNFEPVTRFAVVADVHVRENGKYNSLDQLNAVLDSAYGYVEAQESYTELDGLFFLGDNTQNGAASEYPLFFNALNDYETGDTVVRAIMGNHEYKKPCNNDYSVSKIPTGIETFLEYSGYENEDVHYTIDGYHHILLSMDRYGSKSGTVGEYLSETKRTWLKEQLDAAVADDETGDKPIFVYQHVAAAKTAFNAGGDTYLRELLNEYPNVVNFAGHSHRDMSDPRAVWQGEFTAVAVGSMAYSSLDIAGYSEVGTVLEVDDKGMWLDEGEQDQSVRNGVMYYICEIDENNLMRMLRYNVLTDSIYGDPIYLDSFGDPTGFDHTVDKQENSNAPVFETGDMVVVTNNHYNKTKIKFPQATCEGNIVQNYRVDVHDSGNVLVKSEYRLARSHLGDSKPENMEIYISGLQPSTKYTLRVYPVNAYGKAGAPLSTEVTTTAKSDTPTADIVSLTFNTDGSATDTANNSNILKSGTSTVAFNETLNKNMATFNANGGYIFKDVDEWYKTIQNSFTIEMYIYLTGTSTKTMGLASSKQGGGFEIGYTAAGNLNFQITIDYYSTQKNINYAVNTNEWLHVVGVFDGSSIKLYVNGVCVGTAAAAGEMQFGNWNAHYIVAGAGATSDYGIDTKSKCNMATFNMYSDALTENEISTLYSAYNA